MKNVISEFWAFRPIGYLSGASYYFNGPRYAVYDEAGRLYIADKNAHMVKVIGADYSLLGAIGKGKPAKEPGQLNKPEAWQGRVDI